MRLVAIVRLIQRLAQLVAFAVLTGCFAYFETLAEPLRKLAQLPSADYPAFLGFAQKNPTVILILMFAVAIVAAATFGHGLAIRAFSAAWRRINTRGWYTDLTSLPPVGFAAASSRKPQTPGGADR